MKRLFGFILLLIVVVLGLSFAVLNAESVKLNYYYGIAQAPLSLVVVLSISAGAVLGVIASLGMILSMRREVGRLHRKIQLTERELKNLREIPIKD